MIILPGAEIFEQRESGMRYWITVCSSESCMSAPYHNAVLLAWMNRDMQGMRSCRGIYDNRGKSFRMEQEGSEKQYSFLCSALGKAAGWQYMKPVLMPWLI